MYNPEERERVCTLARKNAPALGRGTGRECDSGDGDAGFGVMEEAGSRGYGGRACALPPTVCATDPFGS